jgi:CRP-like cAMP-binding protein
MPTTNSRRLDGISMETNLHPNQVPALDIQSPLSKFMPEKSRYDYRSGKSIFSQGDPANAVYFIQSGKVKLAVVSASGKEAVIALLPAGCFFGESCLAGELQRSFSAETIQSSSVIRIEKRVMQDLLHREQEFAQHFRVHLICRNIRLQADLVDHLFNSSEKRLARLLMIMANFGQDSNPTPVIAKISQEALANMIGTTRSRVSRFLNRFRDLGYIEYNSRGMVVNSSLINILLVD